MNTSTLRRNEGSVLALAVPQPLELTGEAVVAACRAGDRAAWRRLYEEHVELAFRFANRLGLTRAEAEEVTHDAFVVAFRRLHTFKAGPFKLWLYRIVGNIAAVQLRKARLRTFLHGLWSHEEAPVAGSAEPVVDARNRLAAAERVLRELSAAKREAFVLHELEGLSYAEIAEIARTNVATIRTRVHYARKDFERIAAKKGLRP